MDALEMIGNIEAMDLKQVASDALKENEGVIAELNALQMMEGSRTDGSEILPSYTPLTVFLKQQKGQPTDRVTLRDEGDFQESLYAEVRGEEIEYGARDEKAEKLDEKYSTARGSIFGLNENSREELIETFLEDDFFNKAHEALGI